ncbi:MAG: YihY/virulence factor BrkB family protein [Pseudomonadota bacterium]
MPKRLSPWLSPRAILVLRFFERLKDEFGRDNLSHVAAGIAFFGLLGLFPGISAALSLLAIVIDPVAVAAELDGLAEVLPDEAAAIILSQVDKASAASSTSQGLAFFVSLALTFYSASKGMQSLMDGLNMAHNEVETRGFVKRTAVRLGLTLFLIFGLVVGVLSTIVLPAVLTFLGLDNVPGVWMANLRWPILAVLTLIGLRVLYWIGPDHSSPHPGILTWGTVVAAASWVAASLGFSWYVSNFASYNETFGALGGVIILLMWLWLSGLVILIGAEIDAALEYFRLEAAEMEPAE